MENFIFGEVYPLVALSCLCRLTDTSYYNASCFNGLLIPIHSLVNRIDNRIVHGITIFDINIMCFVCTGMYCVLIHLIVLTENR